MLVPRAQHVDKDHARPSGTIANVTGMNRKTKISPFLLFVLLTTSIVFPLSWIQPVKSQTSPELVFSPSPFMVAVDENFTIYVEIRNAPLFASFSINIAYDNTTLAPYNVSLLVPWVGGGGINPISQRIKVDAYTFSNILEGNQTLVRIDMVGIARGNTTLAWDGTEIKDPDFVPIPHIGINGTIEIVGHANLTMATDQSAYYLGSNATVYGNLTLDDVPEATLIGIEARTQEGTKLVRTIESGYVPPTTWPIEVLNFYPSDEFGNPQSGFWSGFPGYVTVEVSSHSNETLPMLLTVDIFDKYNSSFGISIRQSTILPQTFNQTSILSLSLSSQLPNGTVNAYLSVLSDWPRNGGYPYCPEQATSFQFLGGSTTVPPSFPPNIQNDTSNFNLTFKLPNSGGLAKWTIYASTFYKAQHLQAQKQFAAANFFVDDDGPADYTTIQAAINAAATRDTIYVHNGTYYENVNVNRTVYLIGESNFSTIIDGRALDSVVKITQGGVKLLNFFITNSSTAPTHEEGVGITGIVCTLMDNVITNTRFGIRVNGVNDTIISHNEIRNSTYGIMLNNAGWTIMNSNVMTNNSYGMSVSGALSGNSSLSKSLITKNGIGIQLTSTTALTVSETNITDNNYGALFTNTSYSTISGSNISSNVFGLKLAGSLCQNNTIKDSNISFNTQAVIFDLSRRNEIIQNNIMNNTEYAIWISEAEDNQIYYNTFIGNGNQTYVNAISNKFDAGYPQGGNYWSDYNGTDIYSGPNQDQPGGDGIGDTPYIAGANDNQDHYPYLKPPYEVDVAATEVFLSKTLVALNYTMRVFVRIVNYGAAKQSFTLTAYHNDTVLNATTVTDMPGRSFMTATLWWRAIGTYSENHTSGTKVGTYNITASITTLPNEVNTTNNNCTGGMIDVSVYAGDLDNSGRVGPSDFAVFAAYYGGTPSNPLWYPNADLIEDDRIGPGDFAVFSSNYGKHV
jgi:parallel beta-helix repeat protein